MVVAVTGSSGLIGTALCDALRNQGHQVRRLVRRAGDVALAADEARWDPAAGTIDRGALDGCNAVVHLAGEGIGDRRWSEEHKRSVLSSRVQGTTLIAETIAAMSTKPAVLASGSAVGFYGDRADACVDETSPPGAGFLAEVVQQWEAAAAAAERSGVRTVLLRTGVVLSTKGGALKKQLLPFRLALGGRLGSGRQYLPWISLDDEVAAILHVIEKATLRGPVNLVAPNPVTNAEFTKALGRALHRPTPIPTPLFALRAMFGREMVGEMLLASTRVAATVLTDSGFAFRHPELAAALADLLGRRG